MVDEAAHGERGRSVLAVLHHLLPHLLVHIRQDAGHGAVGGVESETAGDHLALPGDQVTPLRPQSRVFAPPGPEN